MTHKPFPSYQNLSFLILIFSTTLFLLDIFQLKHIDITIPLMIEGIFLYTTGLLIYIKDRYNL